MVKTLNKTYGVHTTKDWVCGADLAPFTPDGPPVFSGVGKYLSEQNFGGYGAGWSCISAVFVHTFTKSDLNMEEDLKYIDNGKCWLWCQGADEDTPNRMRVLRHIILDYQVKIAYHSDLHMIRWMKIGDVRRTNWPTKGKQYNL